jgi:hypothetical protein
LPKNRRHRAIDEVKAQSLELAREGVSRQAIEVLRSRTGVGPEGEFRTLASQLSDRRGNIIEVVGTPVLDSAEHKKLTHQKMNKR